MSLMNKYVLIGDITFHENGKISNTPKDIFCRKSNIMVKKQLFRVYHIITKNHVIIYPFHIF